MLPPVLEVYVVHHPGDDEGRRAAEQLFEHFHGASYIGLIGGAIELYVRSASWSAGGSGAPRAIPFPGKADANGVSAAEVVAIVPCVGLELARAVEARGPWADFLEGIVGAANAAPDRVGVFPLRLGEAGGHDTLLAKLLSPFQFIAAPSGLGPPEPEAECRARDLAQGLAQLILGPESRLQVFISHTRRTGLGEDEDVPALIRYVREIISETRLRSFFDASDLQAGRDWDTDLRRNAATSALLALRTDLYAGRVWCQREMLTAKRAGMPVVILDSLGRGEERGSFLMDHIPRIPVRADGADWSKPDIRRSLNLLVDECLKRAIWGIQQKLGAARGDLAAAWWAPHAPEPITLTHWLREQAASGTKVLGSMPLRILHPDPPLGPDEREALAELLQLTGHDGGLDVMTPRGLAARGG